MKKIIHDRHVMCMYSMCVNTTAHVDELEVIFNVHNSESDSHCRDTGEQPIPTDRRQYTKWCSVT